MSDPNITEYEFGISVKARHEQAHDDVKENLNFAYKFLGKDCAEVQPDEKLQVPHFLLEFAVSSLLELIPEENRARLAAVAVGMANANTKASKQAREANASE